MPDSSESEDSSREEEEERNSVSEEEQEKDDEMSEADDDNNGSDDDSGDGDDESVEREPQELAQPAAAVLSKSWTVASAHVPTFTGGRIAACRNHDRLLLPVHGDVAIVNATQGVKMSTLRGVDGGEEDEEDDSMDQEAVTAFCVDSNDAMIITCNRNLLLQQYSFHAEEGTSKFIKSWGRSGHTLPVTTMKLHISNVFLATGSVDGTVRIWDVRGGFVTHVFRPLAGGDGGGSGRLSITALAWKEELSQLVLAISRDDGSIAIHDLRDTNNESVVVMRDHVSSVTSMEWWNDEFFVSTGRDAILNLWRIVECEDTDKKKKLKKKKGQGKDLIKVPTFEYRRIQSIPTFEQVEGMVLVRIPKHPTELRIITAGSKGSVRMWKATIRSGQTPELKQSLAQPASQAYGEQRGGYMGLVLNQKAYGDKNKKEQLIAVDAEHNISFLSSKLNHSRTIVGHNDEILDLKVIPGDSNSIVVATNSAQIRIFELANFSCHVLDGHTATVLCVEASPCGRYVASAGKDKTMRLWRVEDQKCVGVATGHTEPIGACGLSQKVGRYEVVGKAAKNGGGAFCVTASLDRTLKRWNLPGLDELSSTKEPLEMEASTSIRAHEKDINIVTVAPNDSLVASGSQDKTVKLWNTSDLSLRATLKGHRRGVWDCQFSPIDRVVATSSGDKTIKLWSLSDFSCVRTFQGHVSSVLRVRFLKTGLQLVSAGADGLVKLWTIRTNECEATLDGHSDKVWALDMNPDGQTFVSGGADSKLAVWKDNTQEVEDEKKAEEAETILLDQKLANHLRYKEYGKALEIALKIDKPLQALKVITSMVENDIKQGKGNGLVTLQSHVKSWDMERVAKVLKYCREWNTRARNSTIAMTMVQAIVTSIPVAELSGAAGIPEILAGITPYAERHFDRVDRLYTNSYVLDFALTSMGDLDPKLDQSSEQEFLSWEKSSKLVLPPTFVDGRIQIGGAAVIGRSTLERDTSEDEDDEVRTIGDSSTELSSVDDDDRMDEDLVKGNGVDDDGGSSDSSTSSD